MYFGSQCRICVKTHTHFGNLSCKKIKSSQYLIPSVPVLPYKKGSIATKSASCVLLFQSYWK